MQLKKGMKITCVIDGVVIQDAIVQEGVIDGGIYICQNLMNGSRCGDTCGYRYSWAVGDGTERQVNYNNVTHVKLSDDQRPELHPRKGMCVTCVIGKTAITDAVIQEEDGKYYICQNSCIGQHCKNKCGYRYSWPIGKGTQKDQYYSSVFGLAEVEEDITNVVDYMRLSGNYETR